MGIRALDERDRSWMGNAACKDQDPLVYDTDDDAEPSPEILCYVCPVRHACLSYALAGRESGTWGGWSRKKRDQVRKARKRPRRTCPHCEGTDIFTNLGVATCVPCGVSWATVPKNPRVRLNPVEV